MKKGWTCCNVIVYDWDEFQAIATCAKGKHTDIKEEEATDQSAFFKSNTVNNAANSIVKNEGQPENFKTIDEFNKEQEAKEQIEKEKEAEKDKKPFITKSGLHKCINKGCNKEFNPEENTESSCNFHSGQPVFHDLKKFWTCCKTETWDWDEFMKLPTCATGKHDPKLV